MAVSAIGSCASFAAHFPPPDAVTVATLLPTQSTTLGGFAISRSGQSILFANSSSAAFLSTNFGASFLSITSVPTNQFAHMSVSDSGQYLLTGAGSGVYVSTNSGATWTQYTDGNLYSVSACYVSGSGQYMAVSANGRVYVNNNYGNAASWTVPLTSNIIFAAASATGQYLVTNENSGTTRWSSNYGASFSTVAGTAFGRVCSMSGDGSCGVWTLVGPSAVRLSRTAGTSPSNASTTVVTQMGGSNGDALNTRQGLPAINQDGTEFFFINQGTRALHRSQDSLGSSAVYSKATAAAGTYLVGSASSKYILVWNGTLKLVTNRILTA